MFQAAESLRGNSAGTTFCTSTPSQYSSKAIGIQLTCYFACSRENKHVPSDLPQKFGDTQARAIQIFCIFKTLNCGRPYRARHGVVRICRQFCLARRLLPGLRGPGFCRLLRVEGLAGGLRVVGRGRAGSEAKLNTEYTWMARNIQMLSSYPTRQGGRRKLQGFMSIILF